MSVAENKLSLVHMIVESEDIAFVSKVLAYARSLKKSSLEKTDYETEIPESVLEEVRLTMNELETGLDKGISHEEMLERFRKDFPDLTI